MVRKSDLIQRLIEEKFQIEKQWNEIVEQAKNGIVHDQKSVFICMSKLNKIDLALMRNGLRKYL